MKTNFPAFLLLASFLPALIQPGVAAPPTLTVTTPALNLDRNLVIIGTAADTPETALLDGRANRAGIKEVRYLVEGSTKWRKAQLTAKNSTPSGWLINFDNKSAVGKRITFYSVDRAGHGSPYTSIRFKRSTTTATTVTPTPTPTPTTP